MSLASAPYPPYDPTDTAGFSYETVTKRWPTIVTQVIDQVARENHRLHSLPSTASTVEAGKKIISRVSRLKYEMGRDHVLPFIPEEDSEVHREAYNAELKGLESEGKNTWFKAPWLFAECYLYRYLRSIFILSGDPFWNTYDPFAQQKTDVFKQSDKAVFQLASVIEKMYLERENVIHDEKKLFLLFEDMIQMSLWGNATDLSLLTHHSLADIEALQSVGKDSAKQEFILRNDTDAVWNILKNLNDGRIDFVLDNSGFEVFTDLVFADFLVSCTPYVGKVVFHPKLIPWFVSDVTPQDFAQTISTLLKPSEFFTGSDNEVHEVENMAKRWQSYIDSGKFELSVPLDTSLGDGEKGKMAAFWATSYPYWNLHEKDEQLGQYLAQSGMVIFKGDLNYRKLTGDIAWPAHTSPEEAFGQLAGKFPILSLRTNKADVVVGVDKEVGERLDQEKGNKWRVEGKYALITFVEKK